MKPASAIVIGLVNLFSATALMSAPIEPVHTNKLHFRIPYKYDAIEMRELGAQQIQLSVSTDRGARWAIVGRVAPTQGRFDFRADHDGEYWFAVQTLDSQNQLHPAGAVEPGLKVIVDTVPPTLSLSLRQPETGKVQLSWSASDSHLDPSKLRLEYFQPGLASWQQVSIVSKANGETAWTVPHGGIVSVRGTIVDLAGNAVESSNEVRVSPVVHSHPEPILPEVREPIAANSGRNGSNYRSATDEGFAQVGPTRPDPFAPAPSQGRYAIQPRNGQVFSGTTISPLGRNKFVADTPSLRPSIVRPSQPPADQQLAPGVKPRTVRTPRFQIGYQVEDVGPSGVGAVELFITDNNGQKWFWYGKDEDQTSPFEVDVPQDGVYGFSIRVRSGAGLAANPPQPSELPSVVVIVDQTPPVVQMLPIDQGRGTLSNEIVIRWQADDVNLTEQPISLEYSATSTGPWEPVSSPLANTGRHTWTVGPDVPGKLFIRLTVHDAAGNLARTVSNTPIFVDLAKPTARIVDVESVEAR